MPSPDAASDAPLVFRYLDHRKYLGDYYAFKKATTRSFSYRAFARRAGLKSPNYLKLVIDGDRNLTPETAMRFGQACGLTGKALNYFLDLVAFAQARSTDERMARYERLLRFREYREIHKIDVAYGQYHANWYIPAIRELAMRGDFRNDPAWVAEQLVPPITEAEARMAIDLLLDLELIAEHEGRLQPTETLLTTGPEVKGLHYMQYARMMINRAAAALDELPAAERDISSVTLCLGPDAVQRMKARIRAFRRELLQMSADEADPTQVVQINFQMFPLSKGTT